MIKRIFVDSDIILDVALARKPFCISGKIVLAILENNIAIGYTSANIIANIYYILRKTGGNENARIFIKKIIQYITVLPVDHSCVLDSLNSKFLDFEDAMQYCTALRNNCSAIITRNTDDYKTSKIAIYTPDEFLKLYQPFLGK